MEAQVLIRFLNNQSSPKEREEVYFWLSQPGADEELEKILHKSWEGSSLENLQEDRFKKILERIHENTDSRRSPEKSGFFWIRLGEIAKMAATFSLLFFSAFALFEVWKPQSQAEAIVADLPVQITERTTIAGEKLRITLPDQSRIVVNSLSSVRFSSDFGKTDRKVELDGEAYFEIARNEEKPFIVQTGTVVTTALGTAFNLYSRGEDVKIALTEGRVRVTKKIHQIELVPGEMVVTGESVTDEFKKIPFDPVALTAWKEGKIQFRSQAFEEILKTLEEWYGAEIIAHKSIDKNRKITGIFSNENLRDILNGLSFSMDFKFEIIGKNVYLNPKTPMK